MESMDEVTMNLACAALSAALANKMAVIRYIANRNKDVNRTSGAHSQVRGAKEIVR